MNQGPDIFTGRTYCTKGYTDRKQENTSKDLYRAKISPEQKSGLLREKCTSIDVTTQPSTPDLTIHSTQQDPTQPSSIHLQSTSYHLDHCLHHCNGHWPPHQTNCNCPIPPSSKIWAGTWWHVSSPAHILLPSTLLLLFSWAHVFHTFVGHASCSSAAGGWVGA